YSLPLVPRPLDSIVPLTPVQRVYWHRIAKQDPALSLLRNPAASLRLQGPLDIPSLEQSIQTVVNRHESLRTRITHFDLKSEPTQVIDPPGRDQLSLIDLSRSPADKREDAARQLGM